MYVLTFNVEVLREQSVSRYGNYVFFMKMHNKQ